MSLPSKDIGWEWAGLQRSASESLVHASRDYEPDCVVRFAQEAIRVGREALKVAANHRQSTATERLLDAAHGVKAEAEAVLREGGTVME